MLRLILCSALFATSKAITSIDKVWKDDLNYDVDSSDGWNSTEIINGDVFNYHGWFTSDSNSQIWSRDLQCMSDSVLNVAFICHYGCGIGTSSESCSMFFNDPSYSISNVEVFYSPSAYEILTEQKTLNICISDVGFYAQNTSFSAENMVSGMVAFSIAFTTNASNDHFVGISNIVITCDSYFFIKYI